MTPENLRVSWGTAAKYLIGIAPFVLVWLVLVCWLVSLLYSRANWSEESDAAIVREWLEETRSFRRTLPELVREYDQVRTDAKDGAVLSERLNEKNAEVREQLRALAEPTRAYENKLPGFPTIYELRVMFRTDKGLPEETIVWVNPAPRPRQQNQGRVQTLIYRPFGDADDRAEIRCEYQLHAFNKLQRRELERRRESLVAGAVLVSETEQMARAAGLMDIRLTPKSDYVTGLTEWNDPLYQQILAHLPAGATTADYITSLEIQGRKP